MSKSSDDLWVFGYGSLIWRPGFEFVERVPALLVGFGRAFCVYSVWHRGSGSHPGLVLGLDRGGVCHGMAYRVAKADARTTIAYLREREQVTGVYREQHASVRLGDADGTHVTALFYAAERAHPQYAGTLPLRVQAAIIRSARGHSGPNTEYLFNTVGHLGELGFRDRRLERITALVGKLEQRHHGNPHAHTSGRASKPRHRALKGSHAAPLSRDMQFRFRFRRNLRQGLHDTD